MNWTLVAKYLAGECSGEEKRRVHAWLEKDAANKRALRDAEALWLASGRCTYDERPGPGEVERNWEILQAKLQEEEAERQEQSRRKRPRRNGSPRTARARVARSYGARGTASRGTTRRVFAVAAVLLIALAGGLFYVGEEGVFVSGASDGATADQFVREIVTDRGERARLRLADGTRVTLNVDSRIELPETFNGEQREVLLEGEAYFDVAHDEDRSFVVHTNDASIDVVGTSFNVRSYSGEKEVSIAVAEGAVAVRGKGHLQEPASLLGPGDLGRLQAGDNEVRREKTGLEKHFAWKEGRLIFDNEPLSDIALHLERWYGVEIKIVDASIAPKRITANLKSRSIEEVLHVITTTLSIDYELRGDRVLFKEG